jgi:hypothetical protein
MIRWWNSVPQRWRYVVLISLTVIISLAGIVCAVKANSTADGGLGGAVAAILALATVLLRPDYGLKRYKNIIESLGHLSTLDELQAKHEALVTGLELNSKGQHNQNKTLVAASVIGTFFTAFGGKIAAYVQIHHWVS